MARILNTSHKFCTVLAPGCYSGPDAPIVSGHRTFEAAEKKAKSNDRLVVYAVEHSRFGSGSYPTGHPLFQLEAQGHRFPSGFSAGRYGNGL